MSCPSDYFIFKILKIRLQLGTERSPTLSFVFLAGFLTMATSGDALIAKTSEQQDFLYSALCCSFNACSKDIAICVAAEQELW